MLIYFFFLTSVECIDENKFFKMTIQQIQSILASESKEFIPGYKRLLFEKLKKDKESKKLNEITTNINNSASTSNIESLDENDESISKDVDISLPVHNSQKKLNHEVPVLITNLQEFLNYKELYNESKYKVFTIDPCKLDSLIIHVNIYQF